MNSLIRDLNYQICKIVDLEGRVQYLEIVVVAVAVVWYVL